MLGDQNLKIQVNILIFLMGICVVRSSGAWMVLIHSKQHSAISFLLSNFIFGLQSSARIQSRTQIKFRGSFAPSSQTYFASGSLVSDYLQNHAHKNEDKDKPQSFQNGAFQPRTNTEQRDLGERYRNLGTLNAQKAFVKEYATRYTQLSRLPYFDLVEQIVIDPMHNFFLGLVKTHFYNIWVQSKILRANHELKTFHNMLSDFIVPGSCGKLPTDIGMPSGGSLTADQWLLLTTVYGPIIHVTRIKQLETQKEIAAICKSEQKKALEEAKKKGKAEKLAAEQAKVQGKLRASAAKQAEKVRLAAEKKAKAAERKASKKRKASAQTVDNLPEAPGTVPASSSANMEDDRTEDLSSLHPDDPANFLKLCTALWILIRRRISDDDINCADKLLREYNTELIHTSNEERGTVAGLAALSKDLDDSQVDDCPIVSNNVPLDRDATFFDYIIIDGKRYHGSRTVRYNRSSFVHVAIPSPRVTQHAYGETLEIFQFDQRFRHEDTPLWLVRMHWFTLWNGEHEKVWTDL
ncbi:hypothetical protein EDD22DRAFT_853172 [Suillus occidentalis]|nr:hypothetical protein EDD22DRAFT_853172 [Suillus occidentalis]